MAQATLSKQHSHEDHEAKDCITREKTKSRRFSASTLSSFREEEARSFRFTSSFPSTASSPGHNPTDIINPPAYSFTAALKALQARPGRESVLSGKGISDGNPLHSKWDEAERYISNPLSGQVPMECLSAKALSGRFWGGRTTAMSTLVFSNPKNKQTGPPLESSEEEPAISGLQSCSRFRSLRISTREMGTQCSSQDISSGSGSPDSAPAIKDITVTSCGNYVGSMSPKRQEDSSKKMWKGMKIEDQEEKEEKGERSIRTFKSRLGSCLGWGFPVKNLNMKLRK